jgi:two-component system response regulator MprA
VARNRGDSVANSAGASGSVRGTKKRPRRRRVSSILIVGDKAETSRQYARSFAAYGYLVDLAADCDTALRLAETKRFDAVVTDLDGPGAPLEKLRGLRRRNDDLALVVLSSRLAFDSAQTAVECRADRYLLKPVSGERLLEVLAETLADDSRSEK